MAIPCNRLPALAAQIALSVLVGCGERPPAQQPQPQPQPASAAQFERAHPRYPPTPPAIPHDELLALVDSLANKNTPPERASDHRVVFGPDYDRDEDKRVHGVIDRLNEYRCTEDLWSCIVQRLDDQRYATVYPFAYYTHVATIGHLCLQKAARDLDAPFSLVIEDEPYWRQFRISDLRAWIAAHKDVPLYLQQIERGEAILKKLETMKRQGDESLIPDEEEKAQIRRDVESQIALLKQTKEPIFFNARVVEAD